MHHLFSETTLDSKNLIASQSLTRKQKPLEDENRLILGTLRSQAGDIEYSLTIIQTFIELTSFILAGVLCRFIYQNELSGFHDFINVYKLSHKAMA